MITIPKEIRSRFGFRSGVEVELIEHAGAVILRRRRAAESPIRRYVGVLGTGRSTDEIIEELRGR